MPTTACWRECKRCPWTTISRWSRKLALPSATSLATTVPTALFLLRCAVAIVHVTLSTSAVFEKCEWYYLFMHAGTAGVWRTQAIVESGGWEDRTTAEDMDLALRAGLLGWEFVYVGSIKVHSSDKLIQDIIIISCQTKVYQTDPRLQFAFRLRVSCQVLWRRTGPSSIAGHVDLRSCSRKCSGKFLLPRLVLYTNLLSDMQWHENSVIWLSVHMFCCFPVQKVSVWKKLYMIYDFFIARRIIGTFFTFFFFSVLIPLNILLPEVQIPVWELIYIPTAIILLNSVGTPRLAWC